MDTIFTYFDAIKLGDRQTTRGRTITEADLVNFAGLTGDYYALHIDAEYAKNTRFGERIAHGMLVLSYSLGLVDLRSPAIIAFYGMDQLRFVLPVKIGDTIRAELEVIELTERSETEGLMVARLEVRNQLQQIVTTGSLKMLLKRTIQSNTK